MYIHHKDEVQLVGDTFDWALGDGTSPGHQVDQHSACGVQFICTPQTIFI